MGFKRPCLECGQLTTNKNRCDLHKAQHEANQTQRREANRKHYDNDYKKQAKIVRQTATVCWLCKKGYKPNDPWTADHYYPGQKNSPLLPAHRSCNSSRQNKPAE
jgi:5-methylcytosine-specific restriction protein A